jgi:hypothetical protein
MPLGVTQTKRTYGAVKETLRNWQRFYIIPKSNKKQLFNSGWSRSNDLRYIANHAAALKPGKKAISCAAHLATLGI